jgi:hypothetical protein
VAQSKGATQLLDFPREVYHTFANSWSSLLQVNLAWIFSTTTSAY